MANGNGQFDPTRYKALVPDDEEEKIAPSPFKQFLQPTPPPVTNMFGNIFGRNPALFSARELQSGSYPRIPTIGESMESGWVQTRPPAPAAQPIPQSGMPPTPPQPQI